jgi:hypothetical protein
MQLAEAQAPNLPFARHYWLNPNSVNYTLSAPTTNGDWILAAARPHQQGTTRKNTIVVFRVDNADYAILSDTTPSACSDSVSVIGMEGLNGDFDENVDFEVHSVVQSCKPDTHYVLCGTISMDTSQQPVGMVAILDARLNLVSLRQYDEVKVFYSAYARDTSYYVCGQLQSGVGGMMPNTEAGILLQDNFSAPHPGPYVFAWQTANDWSFHKIIAREFPNVTPDSYFEIGLSGSNGIDTIGWSVFHVIWNTMVAHSSGWMFPPAYPINSNTTIAYYGAANHSGQGQNMLLSVSSGQEIHTYAFNNQSNIIDTAFRIPWNGKLEDMDCTNDSVNSQKIAWVGNGIDTQTSRQTADYIRTDMPTLSLASIISFAPSGDTTNNAYYALHKVHYFAGDSLFHAGGYYHNYNDSNDHLNDRTTFAVTPELVGNSSCASQTAANITGINMIKPTGIGIPKARIDIEGVELEPLTKKVGFCTMDCAGNKIK